VDQRQYVGNVVGTVVDSAAGRAIPGATVVLIRKPWPLQAARGWTSELRSVLLASSVRSARTDKRGRFVINRVPTPYPFRSYTVVAFTPGYKIQVFDQVPVLPGAVMSLECRFAMDRGSGSGLIYKKEDQSAPYQYSHERRLRLPSISGDRKERTGSQRIFATREGLVGRTTANGHVVRANDRFAALPSRRALSSNGGREYQVKLTYRGRSVVVPVWDVGPWNIRDDHWNPSERREQWRDLPQGLPQAQAAFLKGYNGGRDGFGRRVSNPAGIDLADGTFLRDLRMPDNDWVGVQYLWAPGDLPPVTEERRPPTRDPSRTVAILTDILDVARVILEGRGRE
jgi:hypothetical protein